MSKNILICSDLDRTLLPNGAHEESSGARMRFKSFAQKEEVTLAYVSGRHRHLVETAIKEYALPHPAFVIGDVGTTIYHVENNQWRHVAQWKEHIGTHWYDPYSLFEDLKEVTLQEKAKQGTFKRSYYVSPGTDQVRLFESMYARLGEHAAQVCLVWSIDEQTCNALVDVVPLHGTKLHAVKFLMRYGGFGQAETVFAGDSGNDLSILTSPIHAVLVANAQPALRRQAQRIAQEKGTTDALYIAQGNFLGMNGNYAGGVLEGIAHYLPYTREWMVHPVE